jgi:hypothetical protein
MLEPASQTVGNKSCPLYALAKRLSSRKASIRDPDFQVFTDWIPAKSLPE